MPPIKVKQLSKVEQPNRSNWRSAAPLQALVEDKIKLEGGTFQTKKPAFWVLLEVRFASTNHHYKEFATENNCR